MLLGDYMKVLKFIVGLLAVFTLLVFSYGYLKENDVIDRIVEYYSKNPSKLENNEYQKEISIDFGIFSKDSILDFEVTTIFSMVFINSLMFPGHE